MTNVLILDDRPGQLFSALEAVRLAGAQSERSVLLIPGKCVTYSWEWDEYWERFGRCLVFPDECEPDTAELVERVSDVFATELSHVWRPTQNPPPEESRLLVVGEGEAGAAFSAFWASSRLEASGTIWCACHPTCLPPPALVDLAVFDTNLTRQEGDITGIHELSDLKRASRERIRTFLYSADPTVAEKVEANAPWIDSYHVKGSDREALGELAVQKLRRLLESISGRTARDRVLNCFRGEDTALGHNHPARRLTHTAVDSGGWSTCSADTLSQSPAGIDPDSWGEASTWWRSVVRDFLDFYDQEMRFVLCNDERIEWEKFRKEIKSARGSIREIEDGRPEHERTLVWFAGRARELYEGMRTRLSDVLELNDGFLPVERQDGSIPRHWRSQSRGAKFIFRGMDGELISQRLSVVAQQVSWGRTRWYCGGDQWIAIEQGPLDAAGDGPLAAETLLGFVKDSYHRGGGLAGGWHWLYDVAQLFDVFLERLQPGAQESEIVFLAFYRGPENVTAERLPRDLPPLKEAGSLRFTLSVEVRP